MKQIAIAIAILLLAGCADMTPVNDAEKGKPIEFVQQVPDKTRNEIFSSTKAWIAETFILGKATIDDANKDAGRIAMKAHIPYPCGKKCGEVIVFTLRMNMKNDELKLSFTDVRIYSPFANNGQGEESPISLQRDQNAAKAEFRRMGDSLQAAIMGEGQR